MLSPPHRDVRALSGHCVATAEVATMRMALEG